MFTGNLIGDSEDDDEKSLKNWRITRFKEKHKYDTDTNNNDYDNKPYNNDIQLQQQQQQNNEIGRESFNLSMVTLVLLTIVVFIFFANWYRKRWFGSTKIRRLFHKLLGS